MPKFNSKNLEFADGQKIIFGSNGNTNISWDADLEKLVIDNDVVYQGSLDVQDSINYTGPAAHTTFSGTVSISGTVATFSETTDYSLCKVGSMINAGDDVRVVTELLGSDKVVFDETTDWSGSVNIVSLTDPISQGSLADGSVVEYTTASGVTTVSELNYTELSSYTSSENLELYIDLNNTSDNFRDGTEDHPFLSLEEAVDSLPPVVSVPFLYFYFSPGTYTYDKSLDAILSKKKINANITINVKEMSVVLSSTSLTEDSPGIIRMANVTADTGEYKDCLLQFMTIPMYLRVFDSYQDGDDTILKCTSSNVTGSMYRLVKSEVIFDMQNNYLANAGDSLLTIYNINIINIQNLKFNKYTVIAKCSLDFNNGALCKIQKGEIWATNMRNIETYKIECEKAYRTYFDCSYSAKTNTFSIQHLDSCWFEGSLTSDSIINLNYKYSTFLRCTFENMAGMGFYNSVSYFYNITFKLSLTLYNTKYLILLYNTDSNYKVHADFDLPLDDLTEFPSAITTNGTSFTNNHVYYDEEKGLDLLCLNNNDPLAEFNYSSIESSTDNSITRFNGTDQLQGSSASIDDDGNFTTPGTINSTSTDSSYFTGLVDFTNDITVSGSLTIKGSASFTTPRVEVTGNSTLTNMEVANTVVTNYGMSGASSTTLPTVSGSTSFEVIIEAASIEWSIFPPSGESLVLDGTQLSTNDEIFGAQSIGNYGEFKRIRTGASTYQWYFWSGNGTWNSGGA